MKTMMAKLFVLAICCCVAVLGIPVKRDLPPPSNSRTCTSIYHGQCIDTTQYKCNGLLIPGACGDATGQWGAATQMQCCNGWLIQHIGEGK